MSRSVWRTPQGDSLGEILRSLRRRAGLSQEELADGICSPVSVSRIENGTQMPSATVLERLLQRLGSGTYQLCRIHYENDRQRAFSQEARAVYARIEGGDMSGAKARLLNLQHRADDPVSRQLFLLLQGTVAFHEDRPPEEILSLLRQALALTKPDLDEGDLRHTLLTAQEANTLGIMVAVLYQVDCLRAIRLGEELMRALERQESSLKEYRVIQINLALNLSRCLAHEGRLQEAMECVLRGERWSVEGPEQMLLPEMEFMKARILHLQGQEEECRKILKIIVPYMDLVGKAASAQMVRDYARREWGVEL